MGWTARLRFWTGSPKKTATNAARKLARRERTRKRLQRAEHLERLARHLDKVAAMQSAMPATKSQRRKLRRESHDANCSVGEKARRRRQDELAKASKRRNRP